MSFRKATARQLGCVKQTKDMPNIDKVLDQLADVSIEDYQYRNAILKSDNKAMETFIEAIVEQSKQMMALVAKMSIKQTDRDSIMQATQLSDKGQSSTLQ